MRRRAATTNVGPVIPEVWSIFLHFPNASWRILNLRCEFGYCINCDKEIAPKDESGKRRTGAEYTEVMIPWTNGSRMQMACCVACSKGPIWKADKMEMTKAVWAAWDKEGGTYDKEIVIAA